MQVPTIEEVGEWLSGFPDAAMWGESMGDLSIVQEWEKSKKRMPNYRVFIWSLDKDLQGYDCAPRTLLSQSPPLKYEHDKIANHRIRGDR